MTRVTTTEDALLSRQTPRNAHGCLVCMCCYFMFSLFCLIFFQIKRSTFFLSHSSKELYDVLYDSGCNVGSHVPWKEMEGKGKLPLLRPTSYKDRDGRDATAAATRIAKAKSRADCGRRGLSEEILGSFLFSIFHLFFHMFFLVFQFFVFSHFSFGFSTCSSLFSSFSFFPTFHLVFPHVFPCFPVFRFFQLLIRFFHMFFLVFQFFVFPTFHLVFPHVFPCFFSFSLISNFSFGFSTCFSVFHFFQPFIWFFPLLFQIDI